MGKTQVVAALARLCAVRGARVQIVKVVETGADALPEGEGDAARAARLAGGGVPSFTLLSLAAPLSPAAAAAAEGQALSLEGLREKLRALPECDIRICEGAGGIATPVDDRGRDWADFGVAIGAQAVVIVVPDRLGAINQGRLAQARAVAADLLAGVWLNATEPVGAAVAESTRGGLRAAGVPLWAEQHHRAQAPANPAVVWDRIATLAGAAAPGGGAAPAPSWLDRCRSELAERDGRHLRRRLRVTAPAAGELNLADNDYLDLARDPAVTAAAALAAGRSMAPRPRPRPSSPAGASRTRGWWRRWAPGTGCRAGFCGAAATRRIPPSLGPCRGGATSSWPTGWFTRVSSPACCGAAHGCSATGTCGWTNWNGA